MDGKSILNRLNISRNASEDEENFRTTDKTRIEQFDTPRKLLCDDQCEGYEPHPSTDRSNDNRHEQSESDHSNSSGKKRFLQNSKELLPTKKHKNYHLFNQMSEENETLNSPSSPILKETTLVESDKTPDEQCGTGSSGKRRRNQENMDENRETKDFISKKRKTGCPDDEKVLKLLGPLQLPNFDMDVTDIDPEFHKLKMRLLEINKSLHEVDEEQSCHRRKLIQERQFIISQLIRMNPTFDLPPAYTPSRLCKKLYIPTKEYPRYNFVGLIIGPKGSTQKRMEEETGARILIRGKGSATDGKYQRRRDVRADSSDKDDLHVLIEAHDQKSLDSAVRMVERLLCPLVEVKNDQKQLKQVDIKKTNRTIKDERTRIWDETYHPRKPNFNKTENHIASVYSPMILGPRIKAQQPLVSQISIPSHWRLNSTKAENIDLEKFDYYTNLYVCYLPQDVDDNQLEELFSPFGKLSQAKVIKDRISGISKGYGFVTYTDPASAKTAVKHMNGYILDGKVLSVKIAASRPQMDSFDSVKVGPRCVNLFPRFLGSRPFCQKTSNRLNAYATSDPMMFENCISLSNNSDEFGSPFEPMDKDNLLKYNLIPVGYTPFIRQFGSTTSISFESGGLIDYDCYR